MGTSDTYRNTLMQACAIVGDEVEVARRLGISIADLVFYLSGGARPGCGFSEGRRHRP